MTRFSRSDLVARPAEMQASPAFRVLSLSALRVMSALELDDVARRANGSLVAAYDDLAETMDRHAIPLAIRELEALGFVEVTVRGRGGGGPDHRPSCYRLTYRDDRRPGARFLDECGTHEWRRFKTVAEAKEARDRARRG